jgi:hypothetical protein
VRAKNEIIGIENGTAIIKAKCTTAKIKLGSIPSIDVNFDIIPALSEHPLLTRPGISFSLGVSAIPFFIPMTTFGESILIILHPKTFNSSLPIIYSICIILKPYPTPKSL